MAASRLPGARPDGFAATGMPSGLTHVAPESPNEPLVTADALEVATSAAYVPGRDDPVASSVQSELAAAAPDEGDHTPFVTKATRPEVAATVTGALRSVAKQ